MEPRAFFMLGNALPLELTFPVSTVDIYADK
jgi:hypothetical protein